ncbi:MFS transporter [Williamsia deligens]|uniref:MFS transporter n=1 Tax=Williamsia deligens TaxID=321325 RepID=A0ABW3GAB0_9NOCA|nr:MFS transporter [Williamsia deligens]MCP2193385.1 MFS transporter, DHA2 family, multidrug resistance protein [Williamsia deligens]
MSTIHHTTDGDIRRDETPPPTLRTWLGLAIMCMPVLLVAMDFSVLYLAIPTITDQLAPTAAQQLWIVDIYGFLIAGLLITMGNIGDRFGRRRVLLSGAVLFGAASLVAAFAPTAAVLIGARAVMGIGGATLLPSSLSLISTMFPDLRRRSLAIGIWTACFAGGSAVGPVIGGVILHHFWWGSIFLLNVPVLLGLLVLAPRLVPEYRSGTTEPFDILGVVLSLAGILPLVYAVKHIAADGVDTTGVVAGVIGVAALVSFLRQQRRARHPLLQLELFGLPRFSAAVVSALVCMMSLGALSYLTGIYLQSVLGRDVLAAALAGLPMAIAVAMFSLGASKVDRLLGTRRAFVIALLAAAVGNGGLLLVGTDSPLWVYLATTTIAGIGYGIVFSLVSEVAVGSAPAERAGAASGISETSFELGSALGLALLGSLATAVFRADGQGRGFSETLGQTLDRARDLGDSALAGDARSAFVDGLHIAVGTSAVLLVVLAAVIAVVLRRRDPRVD